MNKWLEGLQYSLLPGICILCASKTKRTLDLCIECEQDLPSIPHPCWQCGLSIPENQEICGTCLIKPPEFSHCFSAFCYAKPIDILIAQFKNQSNLVVGKVLSRLLAKHYMKEHLLLPDFWLPVPLHKVRQKERGFNQAFEIASYLADFTQRPVRSRLCRRTRQGDEQKTLDMAQRKKNIKSAFTLDKSLNGESVAIVDDVITTTATVSELARLLLKNGAGDVQVIALARTPINTQD